MVQEPPGGEKALPELKIQQQQQNFIFHKNHKNNNKTCNQPSAQNHCVAPAPTGSLTVPDEAFVMMPEKGMELSTEIENTQKDSELKTRFRIGKVSVLKNKAYFL